MDKETKAPKSSKTVFRIGTISLVFMVIGYQSALLIHRAAVLGIEAKRDRPDTVYVVRTETVVAQVGGAAAEPSAAVGSAASRDGSKGGPAKEKGDGRVAQVRYDTIRREAAHSPAVQRVRAATRPVESFRFNPNTVSVADLQRLGFSEKQAQSIDNYRAKGGKFRRKSDFAKSFVVADSVYRRLEPYIDIPLLDINAADSAAFDALPGIGGYFARKMVEYRERLGGYSYPEQLMDIYNFGEERYDGLKDLIRCGECESYPIWTLPADSLRLHPYIRGYKEAEGLVRLRRAYPADSLSPALIRRAGILPEADIARLERCRLAPAAPSSTP